MFKLIVENHNLKIIELEKPLTQKKIKRAYTINGDILNFGDAHNYYCFSKEHLSDFAIETIKAWMYDNKEEQEKLKNKMMYFEHKIKEFVKDGYAE